MNRKNLLAPLLLLFASAVIISGCEKDESETNYLLGTLSFDLPAYTFPGDTYLVEATGITSPGEDSVTYSFIGPHFVPDSIVGRTAYIAVPDSLGTFTLTLTAAAEGYASTAISRTTTVIHRHFITMVRGIEISADSITDPRDGKVYYYKRFGNLDWFTQNLNWEEFGLAYLNTPALGYMMGNLYTWNQAISGLESPVTVPEVTDGPGQGPQGVCPPGWSIPTAWDWADLASAFSPTPMGFLDPWNGLGQVFAADASINQSKVWKYHPDNEKTNTTGWNALHAGYAILEGEAFSGFGQTSFWWAACADGNQGYYRLIHYAIDRFSCATADKSAVYASVRCVRIPEDVKQSD